MIHDVEDFEAQERADRELERSDSPLTHFNLTGEGIASESRPGTAIDGLHPKGHPAKDSALGTDAPSPVGARV